MSVKQKLGVVLGKLTVENSDNRPFTFIVRFESELFVDVYDATYKSDNPNRQESADAYWPPMGQPVGTYYLETLVGAGDGGSPLKEKEKLNFDNGVTVWFIDGKAPSEVGLWLERISLYFRSMLAES